MSPPQNDRHLLEDVEEVALEGTKQKHQQNQKHNYAAKNDGESDTGKKIIGWGWKKQERKKDHWKLVMLRKIQAITFRFSDRCSCASLLFEDKDKQMVHKDGSVSTRIRLCEECVDLNIEANDAIGKFYEKKKYGGGKN